MKITKSHFLTAARTGYCILGATAMVLLYLVSAWWIVELIWWGVRGEPPAPVVLYREHIR
jgi:hypothetical protein